MSIIGLNEEGFCWKNPQNEMVKLAGPTLMAETVGNAVKIFLKIAYPKGPVPKPVNSILEKLQNWPGDNFDCAPFLREGSDAEPRYYLRLGNWNYPHMKLYIERWRGGEKYFFRADTHDGHIMVPSTHPEFKAISELCRSNREIAEAIEDAWQEAGLPTFKGCLAEAAQRQSHRGD